MDNSKEVFTDKQKSKPHLEKVCYRPMEWLAQRPTTVSILVLLEKGQQSLSEKRDGRVPGH
jgi:hypothetical protein